MLTLNTATIPHYAQSNGEIVPGLRTTKSLLQKPQSSFEVQNAFLAYRNTSFLNSSLAPGEIRNGPPSSDLFTYVRQKNSASSSRLLAFSTEGANADIWQGTLTSMNQ